MRARSLRWAALALIVAGCSHAEAEEHPVDPDGDGQQKPPVQSVHPDVKCTVTRHVDGDTFGCSAGTVRFIGIDAPEMTQKPFGPDSRSALEQLLPLGKQVRLQFDRNRTDRYDRLLAYVWTDSVLVNERLVWSGWAVAVSYPPDTLLQSRFYAAQFQAQTNLRGHWGTGGFSCLPSAHRRRYC